MCDTRFCLDWGWLGSLLVERITKEKLINQIKNVKKEKKKVFKLFFAVSKTTKINFSLTIKPTIGCFSAFKNFNITLSKN